MGAEACQVTKPEAASTGSKSFAFKIFCLSVFIWIQDGQNKMTRPSSFYTRWINRQTTCTFRRFVRRLVWKQPLIWDIHTFILALFIVSLDLHPNFDYEALVLWLAINTSKNVNQSEDTVPRRSTLSQFPDTSNHVVCISNMFLVSVTVPKGNISKRCFD